jgi:PqqD family protein of HPr-rel-A system
MSERGVIRIADDVIGEILDGEAVLLHVKTGQYYTLNPSGTRIWQLIEHYGSLERIEQAFCSEFDVDATTAQADISELIARLESKGLLTTVKSVG